MGSLPELASPRGGSDAKHAARLHSLQLWLHAVCAAIHSGRLGAHPPLSALLELHTPLVVRLQSRGRTYNQRRRFAVDRALQPGLEAQQDERV